MKNIFYKLRYKKIICIIIIIGLLAFFLDPFHQINRKTSLQVIYGNLNLENIDITSFQQKKPSLYLQTLVKKMTLKEKIAQMFFVRCPESHALQFVKTYQVGGYILFGRDFEGKTRNEVI